MLMVTAAALAELLVVSLSRIELETSALLAALPAVVPLTLSVTVPEVPAASGPTVQVTTPAFAVQVAPVALV